jgi:hypothetical protein
LIGKIFWAGVVIAVQHPVTFMSSHLPQIMGFEGTCQTTRGLMSQVVKVQIIQGAV